MVSLRQVGDDAITGRASIEWKFSDSSLLYGLYARGFKSGGVNQTTVAATGRNPVFEPEFVDTFELGVKSRLFDNRVQLNISAFTSDYSDLQFQVFGDFGPETLAQLQDNLAQVGAIAKSKLLS